ncbi:MAG: site-specific integrase [Bacteroidaceae bacterium]|nr:site-specific integrase [Bacteroidaceae bacterium]
MKLEKNKAVKDQKLDSNATSKGSRGEKCLAKFTSSNGSVFGSLILDIRKAGDYSQPLPVAVRIAYEGKKVFLRLGEKYTMEEWIQLCDYEKTGRRIQMAERNNLKALMEKIKDLTNQLISEGTFSIKRLQDRYQGKKDDTTSIYLIWDEYLQEKIDSGKAGTARVGKDVRNRFVKDNGEHVEFSDIDSSFIQKWTETMKKDELSVTYIGIVLRTFRTIVNIAINRNLINGSTKEMFKDSGYNKKASRKHEFLDVATMKQLYDFWENDEAKDEEGRELYPPKAKHALFRDLGLFLFMYLGDGQNLADTLRLEYDEWYFATHGKQLRFLRHKTMDRNEDASEVIFPVTLEIKKILDKYANKPRQGQRVFSIMSKGITPDKEIWVIQRYNKYIRKHMEIVAKLLGLEQLPTPTWARHSFATNLNNSGRVPYKYISDSMGHSSSGDITSNYIGTYPLEKMLEYNAYLLNENGGKSSSAMLLEQLQGLSETERRKVLDALSKSIK